MMMRAGRRPARIGWLATTLLLGIALVVGSWMNYRSARDAADTLNRGQADLLEAMLRATAFDMQDDGVRALQAFLDARHSAGVRYVAFMDPSGFVEAEAGEPGAPVRLPDEDSTFGTRPLVEINGRIRAYSIRPRPRMSEDSAAALRRAAAEREQREMQELRTSGVAQVEEPRRTRFYRILIEFEPLQARELESRAARSLLLSGIGASILMLASLLFWRTSEQYEHAQIRLEEQKRLTLLGEMSAVLAHEIRNPLASLKGHAQLLAEKLDGDTRERARAERVISEATRLEALTSDLLDFARNNPLRLEEADPVEVLDTSIGDVAAGQFTVDSTRAPARWTMDPSRIRQVLVNVLNNAHQADAAQAPRVVVAEENGSLVYEVRDFGPGLPDGDESRIFEPFFTTRTNGTGLGLAVVRRVAEQHGGRITATNAPDGGAVFRLELPRGGPDA